MWLSVLAGIDITVSLNKLLYFIKKKLIYTGSTGLRGELNYISAMSRRLLQRRVVVQQRVKYFPAIVPPQHVNHLIRHRRRTTDLFVSDLRDDEVRPRS
ncbi:MAG: hypothetical protein GVY25_00685 [Bacteroidetes bacterium]|nr:hypothetical protein [Bacteroidota bacterium]